MDGARLRHPPSSILHPRIPSRKAFTLAESMIAAAVLAVATIGVISLVNSAAAQADAVRQDTTALSLARELLELTAAVAFDPPTPNTAGFPHGNTDLTTYDDVRDFDGYADSVTPGTGGAGDGRPYARLVAITANAGPAASQFVRLVTVTVTPPHGRAVSLARLVTKADPTREGM